MSCKNRSCLQPLNFLKLLKVQSSDTGSSGIPTYDFSIFFKKGHIVLLNSGAHCDLLCQLYCTKYLQDFSFGLHLTKSTVIFLAQEINVLFYRKRRCYLQCIPIIPISSGNYSVKSWCISCCSILAQELRDVSLLFLREQKYRHILKQSDVCVLKPYDLQNRMRFQCRFITYPSYLHSGVPTIFLLQKSHKKQHYALAQLHFPCASVGIFLFTPRPLPFITYHLP